MVFINHTAEGCEDLFSLNVPGGHTGGATPVPIPNTEVKPSKADATAAVRQWESRTLPGFKRACQRNLAGLFLLKPGSETYFVELERGGTSELGLDRCRVSKERPAREI